MAWWCPTGQKKSVMPSPHSYEFREMQDRRKGKIETKTETASTERQRGKSSKEVFQTSVQEAPFFAATCSSAVLSLSAPSQNAPEKPPMRATGPQPPPGLSFREQLPGWNLLLLKADLLRDSCEKAKPSRSACKFLTLLCCNCFCGDLPPPAPQLLLHVTVLPACEALPSSPSWNHAAHSTALANDVLYAMAKEPPHLLSSLPTKHKKSFFFFPQFLAVTSGHRPLLLRPADSNQRPHTLAAAPSPSPSRNPCCNARERQRDNGNLHETHTKPHKAQKFGVHTTKAQSCRTESKPFRT